MLLEPIVIEQEQKSPDRGIKFQGSMKLQPGMKMWWCDPNTMEIQEIIPIKKGTAVDMYGQPVKNATAMVPDNTIVFYAINRKNAERKAKKYAPASKLKFQQQDGAN